MAAGVQRQEEEHDKESLRKQLAAVVRSIQWSYAIFWTPSARQQGVLEWKTGYYNGDIKTRKTTQATDFKADRWGLQRSEQLRELYISLSAGDSNPCSRRPSASLSPEDLTDSEWYYLVCMSFTFSHGQGLPGKALSGGSHLWLCNAHFADSKIFSRSLLAKSAFIQTVACFPIMGGVLELGTTELVFEDSNLIKLLTDSFWEFPISICAEPSISTSLSLDGNDDQVPPYVVQQTFDTNPQVKFDPISDRPLISSTIPSKETDFMDDDMDEDVSDKLKIGSADYSSNDGFPNQQTEDSFINGVSLVQSWQFIDDEQSNGVHPSLKTSDCISQSFVDAQKIISSPKVEKLYTHPVSKLHEDKCNQQCSVNIDSDDPHYRRCLSVILKATLQCVQMPCFLNRSRGSTFVTWKHVSGIPRQCSAISQKMLKSILFGEARAHSLSIREGTEENGIIKKNRMLDTEQGKKEKLNEKFSVLRSLVSSLSKVDKVSILDDTIDYLKDLERRILELESCKELSMGQEMKGRRRHPDISERTSDNYGHNGNIAGQRLLANKRKASGVSEMEPEFVSMARKDGNAKVSVTITEKEVTIEVRCPWKECLLLEIVDAISSVRVDAHSVQSSTDNGMLSMTIKSKGTMLASPGMIKQALYRVLGRC